MYTSRRRRVRVFDPFAWSFEPITNFKPPEWVPLSSYLTRRWERRNRWPPYREDEVTTDIPKVFKVDLHIKENGVAHHTDKYDAMIRRIIPPDLVVRRGQEFLVTLFLSRDFRKDEDGISFVFSIVDGKPSLSHGTLIVVPLLPKGSPASSSWSATIEDIEDNQVKILLKTSPKCSIGKWKIAVDTKLKEKQAAISYTFKQPVFVIFNPWCEDDEVFMAEEEARQEYVLEDTGLIWRGSHNRLRPTPWAYSQFERDCLECALYLLSGPGRLSASARSDPVKTARAISAAVNSPDENGLLEGNWSEDFSGGIPPTKWTGSVKILQKYYATKKPVKFAQCWVFSGVVTTVCRTLGIPCRPVTNYQSAHDTQASLTVDYFLDDDGKAVERLNTDSVWNFHVWNEVWMCRSDLGDMRPYDTYSGWQVIDATPQEISDEMYRCGPASVSATKGGEIRRPFDGPFVFSEVNADKVYWHYRGVNRPLKLLGKKAEAIGKLISTKAIGAFERVDITDSYKYPEKTVEEREVMIQALKESASLFSRYYLNEDFNDVRFDFELRDDIKIGSSFTVTLLITNVHPENEYDIDASLRVDAMLYTGKLKANVKKEAFEINMPPDSEKEITLEVTYEEYAPKLCDQCAFNVACLAKVRQTEFEYFAQDDFRVRKPDIKFDIPEKEHITVGETFQGTIKLTNPLPIPLTNCKFYIECPGFGEPIKLKVKEIVQPEEEVTADFELTPKVEGEKTLSAKFTSKELEDVDGFVTILVNPSNEI